jgi:hypothetical protein
VRESPPQSHARPQGQLREIRDRVDDIEAPQRRLDSVDARLDMPVLDGRQQLAGAHGVLTTDTREP